MTNNPTNTDPELQMKATATLLIAALAFGTTAVQAQTAPSADPHAAHASHPPAKLADAAELPVDAQAAVTVVDQFGKALAAGDFPTVEALLDPEVLILESGGAERNRAEYLGHHALSDAAFLKGAHSQLVRRRARVHGDLAWVGSESELHVTKDGKMKTLLSTETMVLQRDGESWRIVHIHWSSRPKA